MTAADKGDQICTGRPCPDCKLKISGKNYCWYFVALHPDKFLTEQYSLAVMRINTVYAELFGPVIEINENDIVNMLNK